MPNVRLRVSRCLLVGAALLLGASGALSQELIQTPRGPGVLIYGNYCGPGNRGPAFKPIDKLDEACMHHDACWPKNPARMPACSCNDRLRVEAAQVARSPHAPGKTRDMAQFISDLAGALPCEPGSRQARR